ncbi:MAG: class I SAM-dependent methyltransferase [Candidatus Pacebacteria bacterium]|nr:class I SAM-dependent methyltransferase [Candidatus Paceibacterota bacterium]MBP9842560.1 class I SAM-dependent methyltransferase [Candidatus Paceibacterota bacterium]
MSNVDKVSVNDIRPQDLVAGQKIAVQKDIDFLIAHKDEFVDVSCPACDAKSSAPRFVKNGFNYVTCNECRTFYTNPRPSAELLEKFYASSVNYAYWNEVIFPASEAKRREKIFVPRVDLVIDLCKTYAPQAESLLEVGAGFGTFCEEMLARKIFSKVVAIEPGAELAKTCRSRGIDVIELPIEQVTFKAEDRFDVIVTFEVIEHLFSPKDFIVGCRNIVKDGGLLIITCPNGEGFDVTTLGTVSDTVDHEHLNYLNPQSLEALMKKTGFEVLSALTPGKLDAELVRNKIIEGAFPVDHDPFLKRILVDDWDKIGQSFQQFLQDNLLSSNMLLIARAV